MKNFIAETHKMLQIQGVKATDQDIKRAYWRDRKAAYRSTRYSPISPYYAAQYLIFNRIAKPII
jgi:hypothetical protein